jgi:hypothetical protein
VNACMGASKAATSGPNIPVKLHVMSFLALPVCNAHNLHYINQLN